jgi:hypothetical protein
MESSLLSIVTFLPLIAAVAAVRAGYHATRTRRALAHAALAPKLALARDAIGAGIVRGLYWGVACIVIAVAALVLIGHKAAEAAE